MEKEVPVRQPSPASGPRTPSPVAAVAGGRRHRPPRKSTNDPTVALQGAEAAVLSCEAAGPMDCAARRRRSCPGLPRPGVNSSKPSSSRPDVDEQARGANVLPSRCDASMEFFQEGLQGMRHYMEDRTLVVPQLPGTEDVSIFGVFDGHGGAEVAQLATELLPRILAGCLARHSDAQKALRESFVQLDQEIRRSPGAALQGFDTVGCTANVVVALRRAGRLRLLCANCGDSRAVLSRCGVAVELSQDHRPQDSNEKRRIEAAGGSVAMYDSAGRIDGTLAVSRALGDFRFKARPDLPPDRQKVIAVPDIKEMPVGKCDDFVAVGSDGVFSVFSSEELIGMLNTARRSGQSWEAAIHSVLEQTFSGQDNASLCIARFLH